MAKPGSIQKNEVQVCGRTAFQTRLLTRKEVADLFGLSKRWLEVAAYRGVGPPMVRITPRMVRYRACDVEAWIEAHVDCGNGGGAT